MSETDQDRTEAPTPKRRREALDRGEVPRSPEVTTAFLLLAAGGVVLGATPRLAAYLAATLGESVTGLTALPAGVPGVAGHLTALGWGMIAALLPVLLPLTLAVVAVGAAQARGTLTLHPLLPRWDKLDPLKRAGELWGWRAALELPKSLLRLGLVATVVWFCLERTMASASTLAQRSPMGLAHLISSESARMLLSAGSAYLLIAAVDYGIALWRHEKQLGMTREEVRREVKESEGDQVFKVRRRTMARQLARRRMLRSVPDADVVITNPTHIAIALRYDPSVADAPIVLAMGERKVAERIKELARSAGVPTIEDRPLARALLATARVGAPIPIELFAAVAGVLAWVYRVQGRGPRRSKAEA